MTLKDPVQLLEVSPMESDNCLGFQHALMAMQPSACRQGPQKPAEPLHGACLLENLTNTGDLFLGKSKAGKLAIASATAAGGTRRTILGTVTGWSCGRTISGRLDGSSSVSRKRRRCPLRAVITGRAQNISTTRRRSHRTSVSGGSSVGHHRIISGAHGDPLHSVPSTLHRGPLFFGTLRFTHYFIRFFLLFLLPSDINRTISRLINHQ